MRCQGNRLSRRSFLSVGVIGGLGLSLPQFLAIKSAWGKEGFSVAPVAAQSVIHIFLPGGMAHQESFDPKPYAPIEYRGDFDVVKTNTGEVLSATLPELARVADKFAIIRSMTHGEAAHERGTHNMFTGYRPSPAIQYPSMGSVVSHELGPRKNLPPYVCIPNIPNEYADSGFLSSSYSPFSLGDDPGHSNFRVRDLSLPSGVDQTRFSRRRAALDAVNRHFVEGVPDPAVSAMNTFYEQAYSMVASPAAQAAFDLSKEPSRIRDEYGRNEAGQRLLMARRLVEAGVRFVTLTYGGWDWHSGISQGMKKEMPSFDKALATLLRDLDRTGMLKTTLVMVSSEFGRTPKINHNAGRDHWPKVFSVLLAGGGIRGGVIHGESDATAAEPARDPVGPADLAATVYHQLGIVADKKLIAPGNRPVAIVAGGKWIKELMS